MTTTNTNTAEMRKTTRVTIPDHVDVKDAHSDEVLGRLVNISIDGLMLMGNTSIAPGTLCQLRIPLTHHDAVSELVIGAEALWSQDANDSGSYWCGFHIIDISPEHQQILRDIAGD